MGICCTYYKSSCSKDLTQEKQVLNELTEVAIEYTSNQAYTNKSLKLPEVLSIEHDTNFPLDQIVVEENPLQEQTYANNNKKNIGSFMGSQNSLQGSNQSEHTNPNQFHFQKEKNISNISNNNDNNNNNNNKNVDDDGTKRTPKFITSGSDKSLNNSGEMQQIYLGLKADGIISNEPLENLIEQKLKLNSSNQNQKSSILEISLNPSNRNNIQAQKLSRSITYRFEGKQNDFNNNVLDEISNSEIDNENQEQLERLENSRKKKAQNVKFKRCNTKQFDYEQNQHNNEDSPEGTYKTQKSILKKRDNSNSLSKRQKKKTVKINEAENSTHRIPKVKNVY